MIFGGPHPPHARLAIRRQTPYVAVHGSGLRVSKIIIPGRDLFCSSYVNPVDTTIHTSLTSYNDLTSPGQPRDDTLPSTASLLLSILLGSSMTIRSQGHGSEGGVEMMYLPLMVSFVVLT